MKMSKGAKNPISNCGICGFFCEFVSIKWLVSSKNRLLSKISWLGYYNVNFYRATWVGQSVNKHKLENQQYPAELSRVTKLWRISKKARGRVPKLWKLINRWFKDNPKNSANIRKYTISISHSKIHKWGGGGSNYVRG